MIKDQIKQQIFEAMKARDEIRLSTLKLLSTALTNAEIEKKREALTSVEEMAVVKKEAKKRKDAIDAYQQAKRDDLAEKEEKELQILSEFLPEEMSDQELEKIVSETIKEIGASSMAEMGQVMGKVMAKVQGQVDGNRVSALVKEKLK